MYSYCARRAGMHCRALNQNPYLMVATIVEFYPVLRTPCRGDISKESADPTPSLFVGCERYPFPTCHSKRTV